MQNQSIAPLPSPVEPAPLASCTLPVLHWDGRSPVTLISRVGSRLAAGTRFVVLSTASPLGAGPDRGFLEGWWRAARTRLDGKCAGWAVLSLGATGDTVEAVPSFADFPIRLCPGRGDALDWLRTRLAARPAESGTTH